MQKTILTELQEKYYDMQVLRFRRLRVYGRKVAIPYGLIYDDAMKKTGAEIDELLGNAI